MTCCTAGTGESRSVKEASIRLRNSVLWQQLVKSKELVVMASSFFFLLMMMEKIEGNDSPVVLKCLVWIEEDCVNIQHWWQLSCQLSLGSSGHGASSMLGLKKTLDLVNTTSLQEDLRSSTYCWETSIELYVHGNSCTVSSQIWIFS